MPIKPTGVKVFGDADELLIVDNPVLESDIDTAKNLVLPFNNMTAISRLNKDRLRMMASFTSGYPIIVDYFRKLDAFIDKKTADITLPTLGADYLNKSFDLIKNMEIKLASEISTEPNETTNEWSVTGEATMYPGTNPRIGDAFIYKVDEGHVGLFVINSQTPLSLSGDSMYHITFSLRHQLNLEEWKKMKDAVVNTYYFDKEVYFNSNGALMTHQDVVDTELTQKFITKLIYDLYNNYFDTELESFMIPYPGGKPMFDAFFVEFYNYIMDNDRRFPKPAQLLERYKEAHIKDTIWYRLMNDDNVTRISHKYHARCLYRRAYYDVYKNGLINKDILGVTSNTEYITEGNYLFSNNVICKETFTRTEDTDVPFYAVSGNMYRLLNGEPPQESEAENEDLVFLQFQTLEEYESQITTEEQQDQYSISDFEKCLYYVKNNIWNETTSNLIRKEIIDNYPFDGDTNPFRAYTVLLSLYILKMYLAKLKRAL